MKSECQVLDSGITSPLHDLAEGRSEREARPRYHRLLCHQLPTTLTWNILKKAGNATEKGVGINSSRTVHNRIKYILRDHYAFFLWLGQQICMRSAYWDISLRQL